MSSNLIAGSIYLRAGGQGKISEIQGLFINEAIKNVKGKIRPE